ncbi:hypothetical protein, conserved [Babesia ovata]|uniref:Uncharacterized protein n=1 Tax=Babesia ovata TaxID=189622 RepID=A0A2H6K8Z8_9APIC|nr:uncharacterized protein BOVATA_009690 [Babesia ovata]GBE59476.1 hypothetical protein, conserved [Babesia ovata]
MAPQFKKLTDCPENLRESIDWLIQVKHGNGEHGLKSLAEALQKLIGEAIKDARESLNERQDKLSCSKSSGYPHCQSLDAQIDQAKESLKSEKSNGKSKNESQLVKLENDLNKLKSEKEKHYNDVHYLTEDAREKALKDVTERQASLNTLKESLNKFTDKNSCETLLTNLTEGLEKFLGFNSDSKGYDGSGIVYADLDRLCDGVMAFLHGVLESVKEDDAVTKYDGYIVPENQRLDQLLKTLKSSIGQGSDAFGKQVTAVGDWLGSYENKYWSMTYNVTNELNEVSKNIYSVHKSNVDRIKGNTLVKQLEAWNSTIDNISSEIGDAGKSIAKLDPVLRDKLRNEIKPINKVLEHLKKVSADVIFRGQVLKVDETLVNQKSIMLNKINEDSERLQKKLDKEFTCIGKKLNELNLNKEDQFGRIKSAIRFIKNHMEDFEGSYESKITQKFYDIQFDVSAVYDALQHKKNGLELLVQQAEGHFKEIKNKVGNESALPGFLYGDWELLKIKMRGLVGDLNGTSAGDLLAGGVLKVGVFDKIEGGIKEYAAKFKEAGKDDNSGFKGVLVDWLTHILMSKPVMEKLGEYVASKKDANVEAIIEGGAGKLPDVAKQIVGALDPEITIAVGKFQSTIQLSQPESTEIEKHVDAVQQVCEKFAEEIQKKLESLVSKIFRAIKDAPQWKISPSSGKKQLDLMSAVRLALHQLIGASRQAGNEVLSFSGEDDGDGRNGYKLGAKLKQTRAKVGEISQEFNEAQGVPLSSDVIGPKITAALAEVKSKLTKLYKFLVDTTGEESIFKKLKDIQEKTIADLGKISKDNGGTIDTKRKEAEKKMESLKDELNGCIEDIERNVEASEEELSKNIEELQTTLRASYMAASDAVDNLKTTLRERTESAFSTVTTDIQVCFARGHQADLVALGELVIVKQKTIDDIIRKDKSQGVKGLLKWMYNKEGKELEGLKTDVSQPTKSEDLSKAFRQLSSKFKLYVDVILQYIEHQVSSPDKSSMKEGEASKVHDMHLNLSHLIEHLMHNYKPHPQNNTGKRIYTFDYDFIILREKLQQKINALSPSTFHGFHNPLLLDALRSGMDKFTAELSHAYVNKYSGCNPVVEWEDSKSSDKLTTEGRNCAKVCLTILETLFYDFESLSKLFPSKGADNINSGNNIGNFFSDRGYKVATKAGVQDGELDNSAKTGGTKINELRDSVIIDASGKTVLGKQRTEGLKLHGFINEICRDLVSYYRVCQYYIPSKPRAPSTVNEMLHWLAGLYYTPMYDKLGTRLAEFFEKSEENNKTDRKPIEAAVPARRSGRMLRDLTFKELSNLFNNITIRPYHILVAVLGNGHAGGRYACDFLTNPDDLFYPSDADQCLDMLVEICLRLNEQIVFVFKQCHNGAERGGWRECRYGRDVGGSSWRCNTMQCANLDCKLSGNQSATQNANQTCDQHPKCGFKSPLQSFLEDGLQGFLPHQFTSPGCKLECSVANHRGIPCKTPMGFKDISQTASRTGTGQCIKDVLDPFCGTRECSLSLICSYFVYLLRRPPQTLGDMFAFYYNILDHWCDDHSKQKEHRRKAFDDAVKKANFWNDETKLDITKILGSKMHSSDNHPKGDMFSLLSCDPKDAPSLPCGQYLQSMSDDTRLLYSKYYADNYLSWIVYITETFYDLLKKLYIECCRKCNTQGTRCYDKTCVESCNVKTIYESNDSSKQLTVQKHSEDCISIVQCSDMHPTLYTYGFTFGSPYNISGDNGLDNKRSCQDFCQALEKVCHGRSVLADLVINKIPAFLWEIRYKCFYTLVALWSLSLLYLLHIAVVRLDVLRIRSHLRSPSSHRIAAQSLLAAVRINSLGKLRYFSP